ncbi:hypothetical protein GIB67_010949 [Kingdonia uniflora]|uniref:Uncharacterized protein n=1 Tax=Kingdonia uniflora TaxID=39325 RepID=A0A7J7NV52_9MAGN|nr:hypothetical protein GIB67_010949 [Kingdonia uniflora]
MYGNEILSFDEVTSTLLSEERRLKGSESFAVNLVTVASGKINSNKFRKGTCWGCGQSSHYRSDYKARKGNRESLAKGSEGDTNKLATITIDDGDESLLVVAADECVATVKTRSQSRREAASRRIKQLYEELVLYYFGSVNLNGSPLPPREIKMDTVMEGMSSTGQSESTNNFFNGWLPITTRLYSFVTKYEASLLEDQFDQVVRFAAIKRHVEGNVRQLTVNSHTGRTESFELEIDLKKLTVLKLDELESYFQNYDESFTHIDASQQNILTSVADSLMSTPMILNPLVVQTKGRAKTDHKKGTRWKGGMEEAVMKKKRTYKRYGVLDNHDKWTYPLLKMMIAESRDSNGESVQQL